MQQPPAKAPKYSYHKKSQLNQWFLIGRKKENRRGKAAAKWVCFAKGE